MRSPLDRNAPRDARVYANTAFDSGGFVMTQNHEGSAGKSKRRWKSTWGTRALKSPRTSTPCIAT